MEVGLGEHITEEGIEKDGEGFVFATCHCGFQTPPMPDTETVIDTLMEHVSLDVQTAMREHP